MNQILHLATTSNTSAVDSVQSELAEHVSELEELSYRQGPEQKTLSFWRDCQAMFPTVTPIAQDQ